MKTPHRLLTVLGFTAAAVTVLLALPKGATTSSRRLMDDPARVERGRQLVHRVVLCIDCHSPRAENGEFIEDRHLTGSQLAFAATVPMPWAPVAPPLAGLPAGYSEADLVHFLMTGERPHGMPAPRPPMPPYRLDQAEAEAVVAYVHSLAPRD
jgi:mono/diheme cytochrome c family protein